ncbi:MAG: TetR/AcrR family transcriptional regulator [Solirubrobacterales bacterium]
MARTRAPRTDMRTKAARAEGHDTRRELLDSALTVFAERGYRDASVDEVAGRAGYSKGALYWHFSSKDDLFYALLEDRILEPWEESIRLLESASPDKDMAPEASRVFGELLRGERDLLLIQYEYWAQAVRDPKLRRRYANRRKKLRIALGRAIAARLEHLGAPPLDAGAEAMATIFIAVAMGLAQERLVDAQAVPDNLLGDTFALLYAGHVAGSGS